MNKLKLALLIPGIIAITVLSCKKDNNEEPVLTDPVAEGSAIIAGTKKCLLTKFTYSDNDYETYEYDSKNRPIKANYFDKGVADGYQKITYNGNDITQEYYDKNNVKDDVYTFKLGSNGYISSATSVYTSSNGGFNYTDTENSTLTYNAEGYLTKVVNTDVKTSNKPGYVSSTETSSSTYTYSNGNLSSKEDAYGGRTYTTRYEYYTDKKNNLPSGTDDEILNFLLGKRNANLLKTETETSGGTNPSSDTDNYTYTFNSDGLVSKQTSTSVYKQSGSPDQTFTNNYLFDYNCK